MKRLILHWTAGTHTVSEVDRKHYHFIIDGDGGMALGNFKPEDNLSTADGTYAAHTKGTNTGAIGIAVAAMHGAQERPFSAGPYPITERQVAALVKQCARLALQYNIPVARDTVLTHAEVQPTLGIKQAGKWDIVWVPGWDGPRDPVAAGDYLRVKIRAAMADMQRPAPPAVEIPAALPSWLARLIAWLTGK